MITTLRDNLLCLSIICPPYWILFVCYQELCHVNLFSTSHFVTRRLYVTVCYPEVTCTPSQEVASDLNKNSTTTIFNLSFCTKKHALDIWLYTSTSNIFGLNQMSENLKNKNGNYFDFFQVTSHPSQIRLPHKIRNWKNCPKVWEAQNVPKEKLGSERTRPSNIQSWSKNPAWRSTWLKLMLQLNCG